MKKTARPLLAQLLTLFLALLLGSPVAGATGRNILFIAIDDMRIDPQALTPNIDALANVSTRYQNAYTTVPVCMGSRVTMMTGLKPSTHGVGLTILSVGGYLPLMNDPFTTTLPEVMSANGYLSATNGKVNHTQFPSKWDVAQPYTVPFQDPTDPGPDGTYYQIDVLDPNDPNDIHPDQEVADWAVNFIQNHSGPQPFFLAIGFYQPHLPWAMPQWAYDLYPAPVPHVPTPGDLDDESDDAVTIAERFVWAPGVNLYDVIDTSGKAADYTGAYLAGISHTDAMVGQVIAALDASPHGVNTDVVLWSDHGYHLGEKFHWRKSTLWEPAVKVPLLIRSPAIAAGDVTTPVSLLDLPPTVLDLAGAPVEPQFEGVSLVGLGTGGSPSPVEIYYGNARAVVSGDFKNIDYQLNQPGLNHLARYNLVTDPMEETNLTPPGC